MIPEGCEPRCPGCPVHSKLIRDCHALLTGHLPAGEALPLEFVAFAGSLVTFVVKARRSGKYVELLHEIAPRLGAAGVTGVFANFHPSAGDRVFSSRGWVHVWGEKWGERDGFRYGPESFQQQIGELHAEALARAADFLSPRPADRVLDLCSGSGTSLREWKRRGAPSLGVELSGQAVECAEMNVGAGICLRGKASERIPQMSEWADRSPGPVLVYANPPRPGLEKEVSRWLATELVPARIAYLSCSAGTLARDLAVLARSGYRVRKIIPYDFFPQTHHVEALALLDRKT